MLTLCAAVSSAQTPGAVSVEPTFLSGAELARRVLQNVVTITSSEQGAGSGFVIGGANESLLVATAWHVLIPHGQTTFSAATISFCSNPEGAAITVSPENVVLADDKADLLVLRFSQPPGYEPLKAVLGLRKGAPGGEKIWSVGREGRCKVGSVPGGVDVAEDESGNLQIDLPSGLGGTSGSPVLTQYGIVAMPVRVVSETKLVAYSVTRILERSWDIEPAGGWRVGEANNFPPESLEAMQLELTKVLNDYIFNLKDVRDALVAKRYRSAELSGYILAYNKAAASYVQVRDKYDGTIVRYVGQPAYSAFQEVRTEMDSIHSVILGMNASMDKLRALQDRVPSDIRRTMRRLSPRVSKLDGQIRNLIQVLNQGAINAPAASL